MAGEFPTDPNSVAWMVIAALVVLAAAVYAIRRMRPEKPQMNAEIARIYEEVLTTGGGTFCMIMLVLHQIGALFSFLKTSSVIQETALAAIWIGGNVLWGLGVALGRRRIYVVTRQAPPVEPR